MEEANGGSRVVRWCIGGKGGLHGDGSVCIFGVGNSLLRVGVDWWRNEAAYMDSYPCTCIVHVCYVLSGSLVRLLAAWDGGGCCVGCLGLWKDEEGYVAAWGHE